MMLSLFAAIAGEFWIIIRLGRLLGREKDRKAADVKVLQDEKAALQAAHAAELAQLQKDRIRELEEIQAALRKELHDHEED